MRTIKAPKQLQGNGDSSQLGRGFLCVPPAAKNAAGGVKLRG